MVTQCSMSESRRLYFSVVCVAVEDEEGAGEDNKLIDELELVDLF